MNGYRTSSGSQYAIVSGCRHATRAAEEALAEGGNVFDAALAGAAVLCVTLPHAVSIGGDLFALLKRADDPQIVAVNATGAAPRRADIALYRGQGLESIPVRGALSIQPPGLVAGWEMIARRWGRLPTARLWEPAIGLARDGFAIGARLARLSRELEAVYAPYRGWRSTYLPDGSPVAEGGLLRQERLAAALSRIAREGAQAFSTGPIADDIVRSVAAAGGVIEHGDLAGIAPQITPALTTRFGRHAIATQPPVSQGAVLLRALRLFHAAMHEDRRGLESLWPAAATALQTAFAERVRILGDRPDAFRLAEAMIAGEGAPAAATAVLAQAGTETTTISVVDAKGNTAALILSIFADFGSGIVTDESGILLNNRLSGFFLREDHPNGLQPGKRTMHTLHSVIATENDQIVLAGGSPGGNAQPQVNLQVLSRVLLRQQKLEEAVAAPRWMLTASGGAYVSPDEAMRNIWCDPDLPPLAVSSFEQAGFPVTKMPRADIGSAKWVQREATGELVAACDRRRDAATAAG